MNTMAGVAGAGLAVNVPHAAPLEDVPPVSADRVARLAAWRARLATRFVEVDAVFADCVAQAEPLLSPGGLNDWLDFCAELGRLGRGPEPLLAGLAAWPAVAQLAGEGALAPVRRAVTALQKSPNGRAIAPLLQSLPAVARHLPTPEALSAYLDLVVRLMQCTSVSIHGRHATEPSPGLPAFLAAAPRLVAAVPLAGLARWMAAGIRLHGHHPQRQVEFFAGRCADSRALLQRERHGTLLRDVERRLGLTLRSLWLQEARLLPLPVAWTQDGDAASAPPVLPGLVREQDDDPAGAGTRWALGLPEVLDAWHGVPALARYRAMLAHLAMHRAHSTSLVADNWSPLQRLAVECFEDARIDRLVLRRCPGLRPALTALLPDPDPDAVDLRRQSGLRVRLARLSRALLLGRVEDCGGGKDGGDRTVQAEFLARFEAALASGTADTAGMATLGLQWAARTRVPSDQFAELVFADTQVDWHDDNRHLWRFIEDGDEEDTQAAPRRQPMTDPAGLPPRLYPEWDAASQLLRPDWASVHDTLQPAGAASDIAALMQAHQDTARHLKRLLDALKPQERTRLRRQEEGTELDLDAALRSLVEARANGQPPDTRVHTSTRTHGRSLAVLLLIDLSASVNDAVPGSAGETVLSLSRAAVALLAWAIDQLGDQLAIAGFHSNTRHEVRYWHIKGFGEAWSDEAPQARLAGTRGAGSTRMGAALRHAGRLLGGRPADQRLLLVLTDGQPSDVDVSDPAYLVADAAHAVRGLAAQGLHTHCVSLDAQADGYVRRIFGARVSVVDRVAQLPRRLAEVFLRLTA